MKDGGTIENKEELATSAERKDALDILDAGYDAIKTDTVLHNHVRLENGILYIKEHAYKLDTYEHVFFVGIGKCAADAGKVFEEMLGEYITDGLILDVRGVPLQKLKCVVGTHPLPSECNVATAKNIVDILDRATGRDLIIAVISGGGSALLCLPHDMGCEVVSEITKTMMDKGATINELNTVRKHLSEIQGGQFAKRAYPAKVATCIFSDVPGDALDTIASGPTVMDKTTRADAERIMERYHVRKVCSSPQCKTLETPKEEKYFQRVDNMLMLTNKTALHAMARKAREFGYTTTINCTRLQGEARDVGRVLVENAGIEGKVCKLYGGETTVTMIGDGKGGRNQELVLGALPYIDTHTTVVAAASDGWDNSDMAGAIGDRQLFEYTKGTGLDPGIFLKQNASYDFFNKGEAHIRTGKTGTNVADLYFTLSVY